MSALDTNCLPQLNPIYLSSSEHCCIEDFITQYIRTRGIKTVEDARQSLLDVLEGYPPCPVRVTLYELNAWLDNRLGFRAWHPSVSTYQS
jgi:hypothetical protein